MRYKQINRFRKTHRFLGIFIGVQFLFWTVSGLYFSWTDIDKIHGDHYLNPSSSTPITVPVLTDSLRQIIQSSIYSLELKTIGQNSFLWVNDSLLIDLKTSKVISEISKAQALEVIRIHVKPIYSPEKIERITQVGPHDEYRGRPLPAYRVTLSGEGKPIAYVDAKTGDFLRIRHQQWRWFDFLWMTHTMDYQGRDNFNTLLLRAFSLFGLITVLSGFALAFVTSSKPRKKS